MKRVAMLSLVVVGLGALLPAQEQTTQAKPPVIRDTAPPQQVAPAGTGAISGSLVSIDAGRPVRRARVAISGGDVRTNKSVTTDERGAFSFTGLPAGEFTLSASKGGYLDVTFGQRQPGTGQAGTPIKLTAGQRLERLSLAIPRGGVITGTITDEGGDPAFGVPVRAMRYVWRTGERTLVTAGSGTTDDRGVYRIPALVPGDYVVSATPRESVDAAMMVERMKVEEAAVSAKMSGQAAALDELSRALNARMESVNAEAAAVTSGYAPVYYPGTTQAPAAVTFALGVSEERTGIDVTLQIVPLTSVSGTVLNSAGPLASVQLTLLDRTQPPGLGSRSTRGGPDGTFNFTGVPPGQYTLTARASLREGPVHMAVGPDPAGKEIAIAKALADSGKAAAFAQSLWGTTDVTVDGRSVSNVTLALQRGLNISGTVAFEGGQAPTPAQLQRMALTLAPAGASVTGEFAVTPPAMVNADGQFTILGVLPGLYRVVPSSGVPPTYVIKSSVFAGRDVLDFPLEVKAGEDVVGGTLTFSTRTADVSGTLLDPKGAPAPGYTVIIFAADARYWTPGSRRIQAVRPSTDGRFSLRTLPPGDYRLATVTDIEQGRWYDPELLRQLTGVSVTLTLADGEKKVQDLRVR